MTKPLILLLFTSALVLLTASSCDDLTEDTTSTTTQSNATQSNTQSNEQQDPVEEDEEEEEGNGGATPTQQPTQQPRTPQAGTVTTNIGGNSYTFLDDRSYVSSGEYMWQGILSSNHTVTVGGNRYTFRGDPIAILFYSNGVVQSGVLSGDHTVTVGGNRYTFNGQDFYNFIYFHTNGSVWIGYIHNDSGGLIYATFDSEGNRE